MDLQTFTTDSGQVVTWDANMPTMDDGIAFYISQLSNLENTLYETKYRKIIYQGFVFVDTSDPEWVDGIDYLSYDAVTSGKFIGTGAMDLPESDIKASKSRIEVGYAGNQYSYSLDEMRKAQAMGRPIDTLKAAVSFRGFQEHCQELAFKGDADRGMFGLFNNPNVQLSNSVLDWTTASGDEIVEDMNSFMYDVWNNSAQTHLPDLLVLPSFHFEIVTRKKMDTGTDTTVLEYFKKNNLFTSVTNQPLTVKQALELDTAGVAGVRRMMTYELNKENLVMKMPMVWRSLPPQPKGLKIFVPAEYKVGGVEIRYPGCAAYRDMI